jgi:hypothetical protein
LVSILQICVILFVQIIMFQTDKVTESNMNQFLLFEKILKKLSTKITNKR